MATGQALLYQEQFEVKDINKKFDKVARLHCRLAEEGYDMILDLDVNSDLHPLELNDKFTFALASTLNPEGMPGSEYYDQSTGPSLMDQYEYVMYGKIYKWKQEHPKAPIEVPAVPTARRVWRDRRIGGHDRVIPKLARTHCAQVTRAHTCPPLCSRYP